MLGGGVYRGSTVLMSGSAGTGKTSLVATLADAACQRGEQVLYVLYEESPEQLMRNMRSIGLDLRRWADAGLLKFYAARPSAYGLENHLAGLTRLLDANRPQVVVLDALTSFAAVASAHEVNALITRMVALVKYRGITAVMASLAQPGPDDGETGVSSLVDTWLLLRNMESDGERNRVLFVIKSRGSKHSNQVREFLLTDEGPALVEAYLGPEGMFVGSARLRRLAEERQEQQQRRAEADRRQRDLTRQATEVEIQIAALQEALAETGEEMGRLGAEAELRTSDESEGRGLMRRHRWVDPAGITMDEP
jgi:circadian clock protein KaiC